MIDDYEPLNDYEDQMDGVRLGLYDYDDVHCKHGTFVGNAYGPDYMCGPCEMGVTDEEYAEWQQEAAVQNSKSRAARQAWDYIFDTIADERERGLAQLDFIQSDEGRYLFR